MALASHTKRGKFYGLNVAQHPDVFLAFTVILMVALLILPIPTFLIDIFISANISASLIILLLSIYIPSSLKLSSFPTILLIATLFRLGLNVATSRLILLNADAGEMVFAFGNSVVGGNLVVGIVIFLILMLINMLVVAKGSERVAEVAARFTLDAMPGKQMSIDADLRAGIIDMDQARQKREDLSRESQLFGAMDGAMKFVKGDVIAGIIIFCINIIAGIIIGKLEHGMELDEALATFAILSVGDGLVSIIPSLLMSVCAGLIVTRVDSDTSGHNLASNLASQLFSHPKAFLLAGIFIAFLALLPGLPPIPFIILALLVFSVAYTTYRHNNTKQDTSGRNAIFEDEQNFENLPQHEKSSGVLPICIEVANNLVPLVDDKSNFISELIPLLRESLEIELGIDFPGIRVRASTQQELLASHYTLLLNEVPICQGNVHPNHCLVSALPPELRELNIDNVEISTNPCTDVAASLVPIDYKDMLEEKGFMVWDAPSRILLHLSSLLRRNAKDFITLHEVQNMLDRLENQCPALVKEVVPKAISLTQLTDILKRLLSEEVSIKDIKTILQTLAEYGPQEQNTVLLTEYVRCALGRYLCYRFGQGLDTLLVFLLDPEIEDMIRSNIEQNNQNSFLALDPEVAQEILNALRQELNKLPPQASRPVILTSQDIRRFVRKLIELEFFEVAVISFQELSPEFKVQPIGRISVNNQSDVDEEEIIDEPLESPFVLAPAMP
ncbi:MAG: type III secretion system export apparatus subunit SctV [Myxococcales bacterium]|nr:type III secretion system export apparatus subunit SctV [Myxococcales bacterium]USN50650.1 MAG: type III secretion system export apparatus subunit SctV [Myxococcales bacterium]